MITAVFVHSSTDKQLFSFQKTKSINTYMFEKSTRSKVYNINSFSPTFPADVGVDSKDVHPSGGHPST